MSTELSAEELALQESQKAVEAEALARAEAEKKQWGDQSGKAAVVQPEVKVDPAAAETEAAKVAAEAEAKAKAEAEAAEAAKAKDHDPHAAIVAFRKQNQILLAEKLRLEGMVEALKAVQPAAPAAKAVEVDPLDTIAAKRVALAEQADTGDITLAEMRRQDMALEREARAIELQQFLATQTQAAPRNEPDLYLEQATMKLTEDYPILNELTVAALAPFKDLAYAQAEREGTPIQPGALGTLDLRTRMAKLATKMFGEAAPAATAAGSAPASGDTKAAALAAKIEMQNGMPPDATKIGNANTETSMTEAELTRRLTDPNLTYEESAKIMATVSPAIRAKLGI